MKVWTGVVKGVAVELEEQGLEWKMDGKGRGGSSRNDWIFEGGSV